MQSSIGAARAGIRNAAIWRMALWGALLAFIFAGAVAEALTLTAVQSRKAHGAAGTFDLPIDATQSIGGPVTVEPRAIGAGHMIVFQFDVPIAAAGTAAATDENGAPVGTVSAAAAGNEVVVTLTGVPDNKRVTVHLSNVNGAGVDVFASLGFLVGDVNNSRSVTATDILQVKGRSGQGVDATNFKFDLNASGAITATDILAVKGRSGQVLPASQAIFVDALGGNNSNAGTMLSPKQTLAAGIAAAAANPVKDVYVSKGIYAETVTLSSGVSLYGGYDASAGWSRSNTSITTILSPGPIGISGSGLGAALTVQQFNVIAASASGLAPGGEGLSSYGVLILNSPGGVTLSALSITAGNGTAGQAGSTGSPGSAGGIGGNALGTAHGAPGSSLCGAYGGQGADGVVAVAAGNMGGPGTNVAGGGAGASGGPAGASGSCSVTSASNGGDAAAVAANGSPGAGGLGGTPNLALGVLDASGLYLPPSGSLGGRGFTGGGGGGGGSGGGTASGTNVFCTNCSGLASGGGGGGGGAGCGGLGGAGGRGGGGSFAVATFNSVVTIDATTMTTANGGKGGNGGDGGGGGLGGTPGSGAAGATVSNTCSSRHGGAGASGSSGGSGGQGGGAAGGSGGPSICVFYKGISPTTNGLMCTNGSVGQGGTGGQGIAQAQSGPSGVSGTTVASN